MSLYEISRCSWIPKSPTSLTLLTLWVATLTMTMTTFFASSQVRHMRFSLRFASTRWNLLSHSFKMIILASKILLAQVIRPAVKLTSFKLQTSSVWSRNCTHFNRSSNSPNCISSGAPLRPNKTTWLTWESMRLESSTWLSPAALAVRRSASSQGLSQLGSVISAKFSA